MSLADRLLAGETRALARALSEIENDSPDADAILAQLRPRAGRAYVIGLTGAPGAGKSTVADRLIAEYRKLGLKVGVLAVDPSSPFTGGAILGDRVRMQAHAEDAGVFIRSMASRGQLGGVARATADAAVVLEAAGFGIVLIETVGVGQAEVEIARTADVTILIIAPGAGDEVQTLKAGIMEIADIFVVNKADREGADRAAASIEGSLGLQSWSASTWKPPVLRTVATTGQGVPELIASIDAFKKHDAGARRSRRHSAALSASRADNDRVVLDHVGLATSEATEMARLLQDLFGLQTSAPETVDVHRLRFVDTGPTTLELVEPLSPESPVGRFLKSRPNALHHICLRVPDIEKTLAMLRSRGVRLVDEVPRLGAHGSRIAFIHPESTRGVLVEIKEDQAKNQKPEVKT